MNIISNQLAERRATFLQESKRPGINDLRDAHVLHDDRTHGAHAHHDGHVRAHVYIAVRRYCDTSRPAQKILCDRRHYIHDSICPSFYGALAGRANKSVPTLVLAQAGSPQG